MSFASTRRAPARAEPRAQSVKKKGVVTSKRLVCELRDTVTVLQNEMEEQLDLEVETQKAFDQLNAKTNALQHAFDTLSEVFLDEFGKLQSQVSAIGIELNSRIDDLEARLDDTRRIVRAAVTREIAKADDEEEYLEIGTLRQEVESLRSQIRESRTRQDAMKLQELHVMQSIDDVLSSAASPAGAS